MATNKPDPKAVEAELLCGNASDNIYLTFKGGCRETVQLMDCYRCTGCGGRFHKDCILKHFELEKEHDWGRQEERQQLDAIIKSSNQDWNDMLDRAVAGEVVKITRNGVELTIHSLDGMHDGMSRVVESAMTLGEELAKHKSIQKELS